jgi:hypothetical protein
MLWALVSQVLASVQAEMLGLVSVSHPHLMLALMLALLLVIGSMLLTVQAM